MKTAENRRSSCRMIETAGPERTADPEGETEIAQASAGPEGAAEAAQASTDPERLAEVVQVSMGPNGRWVTVGRCELCGAHGKVVRLLVLSDFFGWACGECREHLQNCMPRRWCGTAEETEPGE